MTVSLGCNVKIQRVLDSGFHTVDSASHALDSGFWIPNVPFIVNMLKCTFISETWVHTPGVLPGNLGGGVRVEVCGPPLESLTLFHTKIYDFPYPISDLTQNLTFSFRPDPYPISFARTFENFFKFPTIIKSHLSKILKGRKLIKR